MPIVRKRLDNVEINCVMSNSFGFGGTNATLVFKRYDGLGSRTTAGIAPNAEYRCHDNNTRIAKPGPLMAGKRGLIMGVANERSIAYGIARVLHGHGAELAFTYQGDAFGRRAIPLAQALGGRSSPPDVEDLDSVERCSTRSRKKWGSLDFVVHALAFSDRNELKGRYADTTRDNFSTPW